MDDLNKLLLIRLIRSTLEMYVDRGLKGYIEQASFFPEDLLEIGKSIFVSLWKLPGPDLRASKGVIESGKPLVETALDVAIGSMRHDAIFPFMQQHESLEQIMIQVSLLSKLREVDLRTSRMSENQALLVSFGQHSGVFLPELMKLAKWDFCEALSQLCLKSGLPGNMWRDPRLQIFVSDVDSCIEVEPGAWELIDMQDFVNARFA